MLPREPGQLLGEKYRLIRLLGQGGMGSVWHAQHLVLNAPVALKFIESERLDKAAQQRFLGEARMAAALRSPHVVQILDYGVDDGTPHIAMELLDGESLAARLERLGRLSPRDTARVMQQVVRAIGRAHDAGIVHRDLKPENVFIVKNDDDELVKVLDFGIAKADKLFLGETAAVSTRTGQLLGTPYYMSPEQVAATSPVDHRTDIWALGVLVFECLTGELPFAGDSVGRLVLSICSRPLPVPSEVSAVPPGFDAWFARACARNPDERFQSAREAAAALMVLCEATDRVSADPGPMHAGAVQQPPAASGRADALAMTTGQSTNSELLSRSPRQTRRRSWIAAASALGLGAIVALVWLRSRPETGITETSAAAPETRLGAALAPGPRADSAPVIPEPQRTLGEPSPEPIPHAATPTAVGSRATGAAAALEPRARPAVPQRAPARPAATRVKPRPARAASEPGRVPEVPPADLDLGI